MDTENSILQAPASEPVTQTRTHPHQPTSGFLRRQPLIHIHHFRHPNVFTYKECMKNYDAPNGGHIIDGCGEFFPDPTSNLSNPESLNCHVCGCHRNFHRPEEEYSDTQPFVTRNRDVHIGMQTRDISDEPPPPISSTVPHMLTALSHRPRAGEGVIPVNPNMNNIGVSRKRCRSTFTKDQKGKMLELAEKVGWKMQRRNEVVIDESCREIGVEKKVFKVWMHNNKKILGKKETSDNSIADVAIPPIIVTSNVGNGVSLSEDNLENGVGLSEGKIGNDVLLSEDGLEIGDGVHVDEKGQEHNVVDGTDDGSSPPPPTS